MSYGGPLREIVYKPTTEGYFISKTKIIVLGLKDSRCQAKVIFIASIIIFNVVLGLS